MKTIRRSLSILLAMLVLIVPFSAVTAGAAEQDNTGGSINDIDTSLDSGSFNDPVPEYLLDEREEDCRNWLQYDERWSSIPLGTSAYTIGSSGCTMVSICKLMIQNQLATAKQLNPKIFGRWMNNNGGFSDAGLIQWDVVQTFCEKVLGKKFTIDISKTTYPSGSAYEFAGTGEHKIYDESSYYFADNTEGHDRYVAHIARMKKLMEDGYHLVINVHDGGHWIGVDEIKTKANNYDHIYIVNSWTSDGTFTRGTLEDYLAIDAVRGNGSHYSSINRFQRIAAYKTTDSNGDSYTQNTVNYSNTDDFKKWSRYDSRWATTVLDEPNVNKADYIGDWGQALLALDKELIQAGVKSDSYTPDTLKNDLSSASLIGSADGIINWANIKNFDDAVKDSGVAYSSSATVSSKSAEMLKNIKENGYHYIVQLKSNSNADDAWVAIDEDKSIAEGKLYKLSSNLVTDNNIDAELTGSFVSVKYFVTDPSYVPIHLSGTHATVTAEADGETIADGDYVKLGTAVEFKAVPAEDYKLGQWTVNSENNSETSDTLTVNISAETTVTHTAEKLTVVYLDATGNASDSNFTQTGDVWYAWTWADGKDGEFVASNGTTSEGYLKFSGVKENIKFVRAKSEISDLSVWNDSIVNNQTGNLITQPEKVYRIEGWDDGSGLYNLAGNWYDVANNTVYLYPNAVSTNNKKTDPVNDVFTYAWTWNTTTDGHWIEGTLQDNGLIKFESVQSNIQFNRMNGAQSLPPTGNPGTGEYIWNQTADIRLSDYSDKDLFVLDRFDNGQITFYVNNSSAVTENDYRYWTKTDPRWDGVRFGTSTDVTDLAGNYTLSQAIAKLAVQAGLRDASTWSVADCARDCYNEKGLVTASLIESGSGLTNYRNDEFNSSVTHATISEKLLEGYHFALRVKLKDELGGGTEDVAVDEKKSLETNQIWVWRCTQVGSANSVRLNDIKSSFVEGNIRSFKGGTTPGLTSDFDYRRWSRYDGRWKDNSVGAKSTNTMLNNGACIIAVAKMFVQAGVKSDANFTPEDLRSWLDTHDGLYKSTTSGGDGALLWGKVNDYVENTLEFDTHYTSDSNNLIYLKFANPINGTSGYPMRSSDYDGTGTYSTAEESETIMEAIRQGYHMLIEVKLNGSNTQSWVVVDEKASLNSGQVMVMDSTIDLSTNADVTSKYPQFYRIVGYKGATTPIAEKVMENGVSVDAVTLTADASDPAYIGTASDTASYYYGTTGDAVLTLKSASTAQTYRYCIADTPEEAALFESYTDVTPAEYIYADGNVIIDIADAFDTSIATDGTTKYVAVKAINGDAESNIVSASMKYKTEQLYTGFTSDGAHINKGETAAYSIATTVNDSEATGVTLNPTFSYSAGAEPKFDGATFTGSEAGVYTITIDSATATLGTGSRVKTVPADKLTIVNDKFTITVDETEIAVRFFETRSSTEPCYTVYIPIVEGGTALDVKDYYKATPYVGNVRVFEGWYTDDGDAVDITTKYDKSTNLYAHWIAVSDVTQDADDRNISDNKYAGFGLKGVQLREEGNDVNHPGETMPEGLRFVTSLSQELLDRVDALDGSVDGTNVEYGYLVTREDMAKGYAKHYFGTDDIPAEYKLKYFGENVNGEDTTGQKPYSAETDYRFVTNVNCTSKDYDAENAEEANRKYDHKEFTDYRLYSMIITYDGEIGKDVNVIARPYLKYTDTNGLVRYRYDEYVGSSNVCGGCCVSYSTAQSLADFVARESD